jgi:hypothetical protein
LRCAGDDGDFVFVAHDVLASRLASLPPAARQVPPCNGEVLGPGGEAPKVGLAHPLVSVGRPRLFGQLTASQSMRRLCSIA